VSPTVRSFSARNEGPRSESNSEKLKLATTMKLLVLSRRLSIIEPSTSSKPKPSFQARNSKKRNQHLPASRSLLQPIKPVSLVGSFVAVLYAQSSMPCQSMTHLNIEWAQNSFHAVYKNCTGLSASFGR
jgi:hypothetical protein